MNNSSPNEELLSNESMTESTDQAKQETGAMYPPVDDHSLPVMYQDLASWCETITEDTGGIIGLWDGLWNQDDCNNNGVPYQANGYSCGGNKISNWYSGEYIF